MSPASAPRPLVLAPPVLLSLCIDELSRSFGRSALRLSTKVTLRSGTDKSNVTRDYFSPLNTGYETVNVSLLTRLGSVLPAMRER